jgi:hypothetical protein
MHPDQLDPESAALYALIAICLVLIGGLLTTGIITIEQRGTVLAGVIAVLLAVAYRGRRRHL